MFLIELLEALVLSTGADTLDYSSLALLERAPGLFSVDQRCEGSVEPCKVRVKYITRRVGNGQVDISAGATLQYPSGVAILAYSLACETDEVTDIVGSRGRLRLGNPAHCPTELTVWKDTAVPNRRGPYCHCDRQAAAIH